MKQYIDLTQLPADQIEKMVWELNHNNTGGLEKFYNSLGNLYGYPLDDIVNVYSRNLMFDKCELNKAFNNYTFKHFIDLMNAISAFLSTETTPLSNFADLSNYAVPHIETNISNIDALSSSLSDFCVCNSTIAIGKYAGISSDGIHVGTNSIAIGISATVENSHGNSIAIGSNAKISADGEGTIQIGKGTNLNSGSFQIKNYILLDSNGLIPNERMANLSSLNGEVLSALAYNLKPILKNLE